MPLLNKKRFLKNTIPPGLKDTDKVFYCEVTSEVFASYPEFAERIILCNSLVWSCEETGKSGLTYLEAVESEKSARKVLNDFPAELKKPILYLVTLSTRTALNDMTDDVFNYVRERYFVGETVEVNLIGEHWMNCRVLQVTTPSPKELSEMKNGIKQNDKQFWPPGSLYQYEVALIDKSKNSKDVFNVPGSKLRRKKSTYTKERNHLFVKHFVYKSDGLWKLKPDAFKRYDIGKVNFDQIFAGHPPKFHKSESPKKPAKKSQTGTPMKSSPSKSNAVSKAKKQESIDKYLKPKVMDKDQKSPKRVLNTSDKKAGPVNSKDKGKLGGKKSIDKRKNTEETLERELQEKRKKMMEHQQQLIERKQQKQLDLQRRKDEKKKLEEFIKEWNKTREDLELEDLKELPTPLPVEIDSPNEYFGQIAMLYEFFQTYSEQVNVKNFFPAGVTMELLDRAVSQSELAGPLCDILHLLLSAIFKLQEDEEDEIGEPYETFALSEFENIDGKENKDIPTVAVNWPHAFHGVPLQKLTIDATTVTEVLRLHLLAAGYRTSENCSRWRNQEKGGYVPNDDPAVAFRTENEHIIKMLSEKNVSSLSMAEKLSVLTLLVDQVTMFASVRDIIHESVENIRLKRVELRTLLAAEIKKEKELAQKKKEKDKDKDKEKKPGEKPEEKPAQPDPEPPMSKEMIEKLEKEIQRKKEELKKQLDELMEENMRVQLAPLGTDRAYRRYWLFPSISGIFVEDNEQYPPSCLPNGTPAPNSTLMKEKDRMSYVKKLFQKEYNKENLGVLLAGSPKKTNGMRYSVNEANAKDEPNNKMPWTCWGDNETCPVHCPSAERVRWSYYRTEAEYEQLLSSLNPRGKRESKLRAMLTQYKDIVLQTLTRPFTNLNKSLKEEDPSAITELRKSQRGNPTYDNTMFDFPPETDVEIVLESSLRNVILDIEEKTNAGGLGYIRVSDRSKWIELVSQNAYDKLVPALGWGPSNYPADPNVESKLTPKDKKYLSVDKFDIINVVDNVEKTVKDLSCAILQLEQSIELHYLKPPLGMEKSKNIISAEITEILKRWESSLMECTSFAQLFLHLNTLDNSIAWNRSALNANCRICRRRGDPENMLLCDMCNKGHHMYCLKPKLTKVPKGNWYCHNCKPPTKEPRQKKKHVYTGDSDDELGEKKSPILAEKMELVNKGKCKTCGEKGNTIGCSKCQKRYHLQCLIPPLRKAPTISWSCNQCRRNSARKDENSYANELDPSCVEPLRASRRKTSKAANEKIYRFVKQLRKPNSSDDDQYEEPTTVVVNGTKNRKRRTRHSAENRYLNQLPLDNALLQEMLNKIMHHEASWPFLRPVSKYEAADYFEIIKRPMDFATIKHKLNMLKYHTNSQVISESMLVFTNCFLYNKDTSDVYQSGMRLLEYFRKLCKKMNFEKELEETEIQAKRFLASAGTVEYTEEVYDDDLMDYVEEEEIVEPPEDEKDIEDDDDTSSSDDNEMPMKKIKLC